MGGGGGVRLCSFVGATFSISRKGANAKERKKKTNVKNSKKLQTSLPLSLSLSTKTSLPKNIKLCSHPQRVRPDHRPRQRDRVPDRPDLPELDEREPHRRVGVATDPAVDDLPGVRKERGELGLGDGAVDVADVDLFCLRTRKRGSSERGR